MIYHSHIGCNEYAGQKIGNHYENNLAAIDQPGTEFYVPYPSEEMSCDAVAANMQLLSTFIGVWNSRLRDAEHELIRSRATISNCQAIIQNLSTKLGQYQVKQNICDNPPPPIDETAGGGSGSGTNDGGGSSGMMWAVLIAAGAFAYTRIKQQRRSRK